MSGPLARFWTLDASVAFLNHGSFGACPAPVLEAQRALRERLEREPVQFFVRDLEPLLDAARETLGGFVGADPEDLAFLSNATTGVNTVLRSLDLGPGDEILTTNHAYNACRNAAAAAAARSGARLAVAEVPFPIEGPERVVETVLARVTPRTRLALLDHVTSPTALLFPIERLAAELAARGVDLLVDGAHAPGMIPLDVAALGRAGAAYYTGNCHKWLCAPKGAAFLWVRRDRQGLVRPLSVSHGANSPRTDRSRFLLEFDWTGTDDPTAWLCVPEAIRFLGGLLPGGWNALREANRALALSARRTLCETLGVPPPCPEEMLGSMATIPLPETFPSPERPARTPVEIDPLQEFLLARHRIEVPVWTWPAEPSRILRVSAQAYNAPEEYARLAAALAGILRDRGDAFRR